MVARTIVALTSSLDTIETILLCGVNWDTEEALTQLLKFVANAPQLYLCDIGDQQQIDDKFEIKKQKPSNNRKGLIRAITLKTRQVLCEVETSLDTDI